MGSQGLTALVSVSDGKIPITILILRRGPCLETGPTGCPTFLRCGRNMVTNHWLAVRNVLFFAPKIRFCNGTPIFVKEVSVAFGVAVVLAPSDRFCAFSFPSYGCFCEGTLCEVAIGEPELTRLQC